jgi:copper(I)-binding protein
LKPVTNLLWVLLVLLAACENDAGPPVSISDVKIFAPIPGSSAGVAYFKIDNTSDAAITVNRIESPQYDGVQMHETTIEDGVSRMRPIESFQVDPSSSVEFKPGGKHLMLMRPSTNVAPGSLVELEIHYSEGLLIVNATMQNRLPNE